MAAVIGALRVTLGIDSAAFSQGLKKANSSLKSIGARMQKAGAVMSAVGAGTAVGIKRSLDGFDQMGKTAQKIGIPVDQLSRLAHVAKLADVSMGTMQSAVGQLAKKMADAKGGNKDAIAAFEAMGVSVTDATGNLRAVPEVMADIADAFAKMPDGAEKTAMAKELGRAWMEMIPMLNAGAEAMREGMAEADAMGIVITPEMAANAELFNDNLTRLGTTLSGIGTQIAANLAPVLAQISDWLVKLSGAFQNLSPQTQKFLTTFAVLGVVIGPIVVGLGLLLTVIGTIGAPILLVVAGITALVAALVAFWPEITAATQALVAFGRDALDWIIQKGGELVTFFLELPGKLLQAGIDLVTGLWDGVRETWPMLAEGVAAFAQGLVDVYLFLPRKFFEIGGQIIAGLWDGLKAKWEALKAWVGETASALAQKFRDTLGISSPSQVFRDIGANIMDGLGLGLKENAETAMTPLADFTDSIKSDIQSTFKDIITGATDVRSGLSSLLGNLAGKFADNAMNMLFSAIPGFADGTNFAPGGMSLVGENGPELVDLPRGARVIPNNQIGAAGGGAPVVFNITTPDVEGFRRSESQIAARMARMTGRGRRNL